MKSVQASHGTSLKHLLNGFDWEGLGEAVIVDVHLRPITSVLVQYVKCIGRTIGWGFYLQLGHRTRRSLSPASIRR